MHTVPGQDVDFLHPTSGDPFVFCNSDFSPVVRGYVHDAWTGGGANHNCLLVYFWTIYAQVALFSIQKAVLVYKFYRLLVVGLSTVVKGPEAGLVVFVESTEGNTRKGPMKTQSDRKREKSTHILRWGGTQPKLGLLRKNSPSSADFYHLQLPQM